MDASMQPGQSVMKFDEKIHALLAFHAKRQDDMTRKQLICASQGIEWMTFGLADTNVARIADRAGISTATLYRLYPDRDRLTLDALKLSNQVLLDTLQEAPSHPHPFRNLVEMVHHVLSVYRAPSVMMFLHTQAYLLQSAKVIWVGAKEIGSTFIQEIQKIYFKQFDQLVSDGFIHDTSRLQMFLRLHGTIEDKTIEWHGRFRSQFQPAVSWFEEAVKIAEHFFAVHGTAKLTALRQQSHVAWLDGKHMATTPLRPVDDIELQAAIDRQLPYLKDIEISLQSNPRPPTADAFILQELKRLMTKRGNRLDTSNRRSRIAAAALYASYSGGFDSINMAAIAKQAAVSTATLYRVYPDERALYDAAHGLGISLYAAWLTQDATSSNPLARLCTYTSTFLETFVDPKVTNATSMAEFTHTWGQSIDHQGIGALITRFSTLKWTKRFERLMQEGYIDQAPSWDMVHALRGSTTATISLFLRHGIKLQPQVSWFAECRTIVDEFFQIYGTPHFHAMRKNMNWDQELDALCAGQA